jgi:hypothetical protein
MPDPLENEDIGTTVTHAESTTLHGINCVPNTYFGSDRITGDIEIASIEVIEPERDGDLQDIRITWMADMTKALPRRWDRHNEPVTETEKKQARRRKWIGREITAVTTIGTVGFVLWLWNRIMQNMAGVTLNGEPMTPPTTGEMIVPVLFVFALATIIYIGLVHGGFPGMIGGSR